MRAYEYRHVVGFAETNLTGNVYYVNHLQWQGRCRELFLREYAPGLVADMEAGLSVVTTRCSCEYLAELSAFDEVIVRMQLGTVAQNRMVLEFEFWRRSESGEELVARGEQQVAWMQRERNRLVPRPIPQVLRDALSAFTASAS